MTALSPARPTLDVTDIFEHYRLTSRELWNRGFWILQDLRPLSVLQSRFELIDAELFDILVLERLAIRFPAFRKGDEWIGSVYAVPSLDKVTLTILDRRPLGGFDVVENKTVLASGLRLAYQRHFEWGYLGFVDFRFILVTVVESEEDRSLITRQALIESQFVRILIDC